MSPLSRFAVLFAALSALAFGPAADAAGPPNTQLLQQQKAALQKLERFDGVWRGEARVHQRDGTVMTLTQTERVGPMLDGTLRVIEGRGYLPDGTLSFNAFAVISFAPGSGKYTFRSYAQGYAGDYPLEVRDDGFVWTLQAGPAQLRYTATVKDKVWTEVGERIEPGQLPVKTFEMRLTRVGDTDWPAANPPAMR